MRFAFPPFFRAVRRAWDRSIRRTRLTGEQLGDLDGVTILDLTALKGGDRINHSIYAKSPEVVRLIGERLIEGQVITDTDVSPINTLGNAAGLAATAPIRVFEAGRR